MRTKALKDDNDVKPPEFLQYQITSQVKPVNVLLVGIKKRRPLGKGIIDELLDIKYSKSGCISC